MEIVIKVLLDPQQVSAQRAATLAAECKAYVEGMVETHPVMRGGGHTGAVAPADYEITCAVNP